MGAMYDDLDDLHEDLGRARRHLYDLETAELQGRVALKDLHRHSLRKARERVLVLERELAELVDRLLAEDGAA